MTEELSADNAAGPTSDALSEQNPAGRPLEVRQAEEQEPKPEPKKSDSESRSDAVKRAIEKAQATEKSKDEAAKAEKTAAEDATPKKAESAEEKKTAEAEQRAAEKPAAGREAEEGRQSEGRKHTDAPARFLPEAREKWSSVPREVKGEIHRVSQEYEAELKKARDSSERYEPLRQFDEMARQNGGSLEQSLRRVVEIETALAQNPISGLDMILRQAGPRKPDGSPMSIVEVAQFISQQTPQQMQALMNKPQVQQKQPDPEVNKLRQQMNEMQRQFVSTSLSPVIESFAAKHPDYAQLEPQIAAVLRKGVVDEIYGTGLSPEQRLSAAYRMVGGHIVPSHADPEPAPENSQPAQARQANPAGRKSVAGSPSGEPKSKPKNLSRSDAIAKAMRQAGL